jgi:hypothetical protein
VLPSGLSRLPRDFPHWQRTEDRQCLYPNAALTFDDAVSRSDKDALLERLARLNELLDVVESACADSAEVRTTIVKARSELQATARSLRIATPADFTGDRD